MYFVDYKLYLSFLEKRYVITKEGKVFNRKTKKETIFCKDTKGYLKARLYAPEIATNKDKRVIVKQHRLVASKFLKDFDKTLQVNHINGDKSDNRLKNLEMVTASQNSLHGWTLDKGKRKQKLIKNNIFRGMRNTAFKLGIDMTPEYIQIAKARIEKAKSEMDIKVI